MSPHMRMTLACAAAVTSAFLAGCGSKADANAKNFGAAIADHLKDERLCLDTDRWPVDLPASGAASKADGDAESPGMRMRALQKAGLVSASEVEIDEGARFGRATGHMRKVVRHSLTESAKPYTRETGRVHLAWGAEQPTKVVELCWGRKHLDKVVKWEGPMEFGAFKTARVIFTYTIVDVADWSQSAEMQDAFRTIGVQLQMATKEDARAVKLTSEGWEVNGGRF
jgi:hypothetical protein